MTKLVLFDGNAIMHRAFHALPPLTTKTGEPINAVYGLISMLLRVIQELHPTHIVFAFDRPEPTFRKQLFEEYQSQRPEMDDELGSQFEKAYRVIEAFDIPLYSKAGFEADDVIGTIAKQSIRVKEHESKSADEVVIVTGDRDILQLVDNKIKLCMPGKGLSSAFIFGEKETIEKMGVKPEKIVDLKGLIGDPSDNYKGIPGIGPKTAQKLLNQYDNFEGIYKHLDEVPESTRKKLVEGRQSGEMSYDLARIRCDVEGLDFDLEKAGKWQVNSQKVKDLFEEYGFRTLSKRILDVGKQLQEEKQGTLL